jgi:hypothetical protein
MQMRDRWRCRKLSLTLPRAPTWLNELWARRAAASQRVRLCYLPALPDFSHPVRSRFVLGPRHSPRWKRMGNGNCQLACMLQVSSRSTAVTYRCRGSRKLQYLPQHSALTTAATTEAIPNSRPQGRSNHHHRLLPPPLLRSRGERRNAMQCSALHCNLYRCHVCATWCFAVVRGSDRADAWGAGWVNGRVVWGWERVGWGGGSRWECGWWGVRSEESR